MSRGPRIVVTREAADAGAVIDALEREGLDGWAVPTADLAPLVAALSDGAVQGLTFFSPSSAHSLARVLGGTLSRLAGQVTLAAIGPTTARALAVLGAPADVVSPVPTAGALAQALARHFARAGATL